MATVQEPRSARRAEQFVQKELARAVRRVRLLDLARAGLGLLIAVMAYGLIMILLDRWLNLPQTFRQISFVGFCLFVVAYVWFVLLGPIRRAVNPYYAALQVEQTIPDAKNSLVNWLDLHDDNLPQGVVNAIGERAADDLKESNVDEAINSKSVLWLAGITVGLFLGFAISFIIFRGDQFGSLLGRAFSPFGLNRGIVKQTRITIVTPADGDATVAINRPVTITVRVEGRIPETDRPDSVRLLIRYNGDDPAYDKELPLKLVDGPSGEWSIRLGLNEVRTGFWYRIAGGDDLTEEHRVTVRSTPNIERFEIVSKYRPYLRWGDRPSTDPNVEDYRGTQITLDAVTNRQVREGRMLMATQELGKGDVKSNVVGELVPGRPDVVRFKFTLDRDAKYRIWFSTVEDESNNDPNPYTIHVLQDVKPTVEITKPGAELALGADEMLRLQGIARDDFGLRKITLRMTLDGLRLKSKEYMTEKDFRLDTGGFMKTIDYKDDVDLMKLQTELGSPVKPATGNILEYWLEAVDNCDYPDGSTGQIGVSQKYKVKILPPKIPDNPIFNPNDPMKAEDEKKEHDLKKEVRDQARTDANKEKQDHDKKHENDRQEQGKQDKAEHEDRAQKDADAKTEIDKKKQSKDNGAAQPEKANPDGKNGEKPDKNDGDKAESKSEGDKKFEDFKKDAENLQNEGANSKPPDQSAEKDQNPSETKPENPPMNPDASKDGDKGKEDPSQMKDNGGGKSDMDNAAANKPPDKPQEGGGAQGDSKNPPAPNQKPDANPKPGETGGGENNTPNNSNKQDGGKGADKGKGDPAKPDDKNKGGDGPQRDPKANPMDPGAAKGDPKNNEPSETKPANPGDPSAAPKQDQKKPGDGAPDKADKKGSQDGNSPKDDAKKDSGGGETPKKPQAPSGQNKQPGKDDPNAKTKPTDKTDGNLDNKDKDQPGGNKAPADAKDAKDAADSKPMPNDKPGQGTPEPNDKKPGEGGGDKDKPQDKKDGSGGKDDVSKLEDQAKNGNAAERDAAKKKLGEMAQDKKDPAKQKAAEEALKRAENGQPSPNQPQDPKGGDPKNQSPMDPKNSTPKPNDQGKQAGEQNPSKTGDPKPGDKTPKPSDQANKSPSQSKQSQSSDPKESCDKKACENPGNSGAPKSGGAPGSAETSKAGESKPGPKDAKGKGDTGTGGDGKTDDAPKANDTPKPGGDPKGAPDPKKPGDQAKGDDKAGNPAKDAAKGNDPKGKGEPGQAGKDTAKGNGTTPDGKPEKGDPSGVGGQPGIPTDSNRTGNNEGNSPSDKGPSTAPKQNFKDRSSDLELEKVDKEKLKKLFDKHGITEEQWREYLRQQEAKKKDEAAKAKGKDFAPGDRSGGTNVNTGPRRVETSNDKDSSLRSGSSGSAPPEYKKAADKFAEKMAKEPAKK